MSKSLPARPDLNQLKAQAKELLRAHEAYDAAARQRFANYRLDGEPSALRLADAQLVIAREYGFASWREMKAQGDRLTGDGMCALERAILGEDIPALEAEIAAHPDLVREPGSWTRRKQPFKPLTFACNYGKLEAARCLIRHGADAAEDHNYPLFRAGLHEGTTALLDLLREYGADVNGVGLSFDGTLWGPIVLGSCETLEPECLEWFVRHGAEVDFFYERTNGEVMNCADMLLKTYVQRPELRAACLRILRDAGARMPDTAFVDLLSRDTEALDRRLRSHPGLLDHRWSLEELLTDPFRYGDDEDYTTIEQATLLHAAIEKHDLEMAAWMIDRGADVNARAGVLPDGSGGHTPLFHAAIASTTAAGGGKARVEFLLKRGADPTIRANPRHRKMHGRDDLAGTVEQGITAREWCERYEGRAAWIDTSALEVLP